MPPIGYRAFTHRTCSEPFLKPCRSAGRDILAPPAGMPLPFRTSEPSRSVTSFCGWTELAELLQKHAQPPSPYPLPLKRARGSNDRLSRPSPKNGQAPPVSKELLSLQEKSGRQGWSGNSSPSGPGRPERPGEGTPLPLGQVGRNGRVRAKQKQQSATVKKVPDPYVRVPLRQPGCRSLALPETAIARGRACPTSWVDLSVSGKYA